MNRAPRRVSSPQYGVAAFDPRRTPSSADYDDVDHHHPHQHPFNDNNNSVAPFDHPNHQSEPVQFQAESRSNYPIGYRDQHLPSTYRATLTRGPPPPQAPPQAPIPAPTPTYKILCITNINPKIGDLHVKEALVSDFSRFGDISVSICHDSGERLVYIYFRTYEEAREARHVKARSILFDRPIEIEPIYEPRFSPGESPPPQQYPVRRRSITPPDYYSGMQQPQPRRAQFPPSSFAPHHHRPPSPPNYLYSSRYPAAPPIAPNQAPYGRYHLPDVHFPIHPSSPYNSPPAEPHRPYPTHPAHQYSPSNNQPNPPPPYGYMPHRERERSIPDPYAPRSPRSEHFYDQRDYIGPPIPHSSRGPQPLGHYPHPVSPPNPYYRPAPSSIRRSTPPYADKPRYIGREFKRARAGPNNVPERDESKPSRVIFITALDSSTSDSQLREVFDVFGSIEELEVKKISPDISSAIVKFSSMDCAYRAKTAMNGKYIGNSKCRITYGKVSASRRLWLGGLGPTTTLTSLDEEFGKFGEIVSLDYVSGRPYGYVEYETANQAQFAVMHLKGSLVAGADKRLRIEYVDSEKSSKPEPNINDKGSRLRSNDIWNNDDQGSNEQIERKRSISPPEVNAKRIPPPVDDSTELNYYESCNRSSGFLNAKSSTSTSNSPVLDKSVNQDNSERNNNSRDKNVCNDHNLDTKQAVRSSDITNASGTGGVWLVKSVNELVDCCEVSWMCRLVLRNFNFPSRMFMCSGHKETIEKYLSKLSPEDRDLNPILKITQRWRLHPQPKLEEVKRRMQSGNLGILIIKQRFDQSPISSPASKTQQQISSAQNAKSNGGEKDISVDEAKSEASEGSSTQPRPLKNLICYLEQKDAAGVISLCPDGERGDSSKLLYTFPPGEFALNLLRTVTPNLIHEASVRSDFLVGVIVGTTETKVT